MSQIKGVDYTLEWPVGLLRAELSSLINRTDAAGWSDRVELLLEEAFVDSVPKDLFMEARNAGSFPNSRSGVDPGRKFLASLLQNLDTLPTAGAPKRYWSERKHGEPHADNGMSITRTIREVVQIIGSFDDQGYFEMAFGKDCVDDPRERDPNELIERRIGVDNVWPVYVNRFAGDEDLLFDVLEVLHDLVARPRSRSLHGYSNCGYHHHDFSRGVGQQLYRWRINEVLDRAGLGVRFAEDGEDEGRLTTTTDTARTDLLHAMTTRTDPSTGDQVRHAIALYRSRDADEHQKRSAVVALAGVLEERRTLLKDRLVRKDEGALFQIANEFAIRHRNASQRPDYSPHFLDWIFWWYLATIELTDHLMVN